MLLFCRVSWDFLPNGKANIACAGDSTVSCRLMKTKYGDIIENEFMILFTFIKCSSRFMNINQRKIYITFCIDMYYNCSDFTVVG